MATVITDKGNDTMMLLAWAPGPTDRAAPRARSLSASSPRA